MDKHIWRGEVTDVVDLTLSNEKTGFMGDMNEEGKKQNGNNIRYS
jgi:hypothetical protein